MADSLAAQVEEFMAGAASLTEEVWDDIASEWVSAGDVSEVIDAARGADGGKYLRPRLVSASYLAFGGCDPELLRRVAAAQQMLHVGLCIHDDLIDGDRVRHDRLTVAARIEQKALEEGLGPHAATRRAEAAGLLAGDLAIIAAVSVLAAAPAEASVRSRLVSAATIAIGSAILGEALDVWSESMPPELSDPRRIATLKTASYSVTLPLTLGAIAAGVEDEQALSTIADVGSLIGVAYQLSDDDLGLFGRPAETGKSVISDIRDGKRTEHIRLAALRATPAQRRVMEAHLGRADLDGPGAQRVRDLVIETGSRAQVLRIIDGLVQEAARRAESGLPRPLALYLASLVTGFRDRPR
ncbi:polyprenyl synthetase family protein [Microbacterium sp. NPDC019599]|uniref:polyprenyl synthetase family protein n=1 Tax=Microbacterium sp. NPDC019599 TaxID=3154690 RepID=UPI0033CABE22